MFAIAVAAAVGKLPVEAVTVGDLKIVFSVTSFQDVARALGRLRTAHTGDAGESRTQGCYTTSGPDPVALYVESDEMGASKFIMGVDVAGAGVPAASYDPVIAKACTRLLQKTLEIRTDRGITLGLPRSEVERLMGGKGRDSAGITIYEATERRRDQNGAFDASSELLIRYRKGRVAAFHAGAVFTT